MTEDENKLLYSTSNSVDGLASRERRRREIAYEKLGELHERLRQRVAKGRLDEHGLANDLMDTIREVRFLFALPDPEPLGGAQQERPDGDV